jgi:hypothetical protein
MPFVGRLDICEGTSAKSIFQGDNASQCVRIAPGSEFIVLLARSKGNARMKNLEMFEQNNQAKLEVAKSLLLTYGLFSDDVAA